MGFALLFHATRMSQNKSAHNKSIGIKSMYDAPKIHTVENSNSPSEIPQHSLIHAQLTLCKVIQTSYFALKKEGEYAKEARPPKFLPKDGCFNLEFIERQIKRGGKLLRLSFGKRKTKTLDRGYLYDILTVSSSRSTWDPYLGWGYIDLDYLYDYAWSLSGE